MGDREKQKEHRTNRMQTQVLAWCKRHSAFCFGFLAFFLPVWIMLVAFYASAVYPFGKDTFMRMDMFVQYLPFFTEFMRHLKAGESIAYSWNVGIGTNFQALYGYYLASPFYWFGYFVPEQYYIEFMSYIVIVKIGLTGLASYWYLYTRNTRMQIPPVSDQENPIYMQAAAMTLSLGYALSGFVAAYNWNGMWLEPVMLLPIVLIGLEQLVMEGKPFWYCGALAVSILCNFYLSIMVCIFLVLYFGYLVMTQKRWSAVWKFAIYSLLAGGIAAALLVPEILTLLASSDYGALGVGERTGSYYALSDLLARHCMLVTTEMGKDYGYWPNIYCGVCVFLLIPLYICNKHIRLQMRIGMTALAAFFVVSFNTPALDYLWHGMNYPNGLPARQSFLYALLLMTMCHECITHMDYEDRRERRKVLAVYLLALLLLLFWAGFAAQEDLMPGAVWVTLAFVTAYAVLLYLAFRYQRKDARELLVFLAVLTMTVEIHINTQATSVVCNTRADYFEHTEEYQALYQWVQNQDGEVYRLEALGAHNMNDGARIGFPSASVFSSTVNAKVKNFYLRLGLRGSKMFYSFDGSTALTTALLNVKYLLHPTASQENSLYTVVQSYGESGYLYRNEQSLPFGYVAPTGWELRMEESDGIQLQNQLVADLGIAESLFEECEAEQTEEGALAFTAPTDGIYYGLLLSSDITKVSTGGTNAALTWSYMERGSVFYLGQMQAGKRAWISNGELTEEQKQISAKVYRLNEAVLEKAVELLSAQHLEQVQMDSTHIRGTLSLAEAGRLILSVPYEKGWQVTLNGESVETSTFGDALIALDLAPGEYVLEMQYTPYGGWIGIVISAGSALAFLGSWLVWYKWNQKKGRNDAEIG